VKGSVNASVTQRFVGTTLFVTDRPIGIMARSRRNAQARLPEPLVSVIASASRRAEQTFGANRTHDTLRNANHLTSPLVPLAMKSCQSRSAAPLSARRASRGSARRLLKSSASS
jgi:hypothetical protein